MSKKRLAIFASGSGTNAEELFKKFKHHQQFEIGALFCNKSDARVLDRAKNHDIESIVFLRSDIKDGSLLKKLRQHNIDFIVLAGYLWLIPSDIVNAYPKKIVNIHPALLPKFGGKGMYGMKVHERVLKDKEDKSGITIHYVNENYDEGSIIFQSSINVNFNDTPESLANKIHKLEHKYYPEVVEEILEKTFL